MTQTTRLGPHAIPFPELGSYAGKVEFAVSDEVDDAVPTYLRTALAIAMVLHGVSDVGRIHAAERWIRDNARVNDLFAVPGETTHPDGRRDLRGWILSRESIAEDPWTNLRTKSQTNWKLRGFLGTVDKSGATETDAQNLADRVWAAFRAVTSVGTVDSITAPTTPILSHSILPGPDGGTLCHYCEVELVTEETHTIETVTQPSHGGASATEREGYSDAVNQIAGYLRGVSAAQRVHAFRVHNIATADFLDSFSVPGESTTRRLVRGWQVYRDESTEERGLGNLVNAESQYRLQGAWGWRDDVGSYERFHTHVDDVRARFRALGNLGNLGNPTQVLSSPLQLSFPPGGGMLQGTVRCHFVDCTLAVREVVHA